MIELGCGVGSFTDIDRLTMFADYRVPQSLQQYGVLRYRGIISYVKKYYCFLMWFKTTAFFSFLPDSFNP